MPKTYTESILQLAIFSIEKCEFKSEERVTEVYNVPRTTLHNRRAGRQSRCDCQPNLLKLTLREEKVILESILEQCGREVAPTKGIVREMADRLLQGRGKDLVGKNSVDNFIKRTPELKTKWSRPYDRQRALC